MTEREILQQRSRIRLARWERRVRDLLESADREAGVDLRSVAQPLRELIDRRDAARNKLEKLRRVSNRRFAEARRELEQAFRALTEAWDGTVTRLPARTRGHHDV